ncbi:hypothetical protein [Sphingomonas sp.]|uniref:hypothetical protein n=1 Tax=Sphingomonas sp. TaxID=28214 RepID=UPI00258EE005|nr:hypothetical protein [Sphingomonas sp.]
MKLMHAPATADPVRQHVDLLSADVLLDRIWFADWADIRNIQLLPGYPLECDEWILSHEWASAGQKQNLGRRIVSFSQLRAPSGDPAYLHREHSIRRLKRIGVLLFTQTVPLNLQMRGPVKPSTWVRTMQRLIDAAAVALDKPAIQPAASTCPDGDPIFRNLTPDELRTAFKGSVDELSSAIPRLNGLLKMGQFDDWPAEDVYVEGSKRENVWQPFSDEFVAVAGSAALWMSETLGPHILEAWEALRYMASQPVSRSNPLKAAAERQAYASRWAETMQQKGIDLKFQFALSRLLPDQRRGVLSSFDQVTPRAIGDLAYLLQEAHAWIISLAAAPRNGELVSLPRDCLRPVQGGSLMSGYTFKLSDSEESRDWPIPKVAVEAIRLQQRLAEIVDPGGDRLFIVFKILQDKDKRHDRDRNKFNAEKFAQSVFTLDGDSLESLCTGNIHAHRFRKTVSRLAALSLVGANEILFDILGHRDPEMTLAYILSDPELQEEMRVIAREAAILITKKAVEQADDLGGPAASGVKELVGRYRARSAEGDMDETSIMVVARLLSQNGRVTLVKRNVLCTKTLQQAGPCNRRTGNPDIGNCQVGCLHRLELAAARHDHKLALARAVKAFHDAEGMMRSWWQGQIIGHLLPFPDLARDALADPDVRSALEGVDLMAAFDDYMPETSADQRAALAELL